MEAITGVLAKSQPYNENLGQASEQLDGNPVKLEGNPVKLGKNNE